MFAQVQLFPEQASTTAQHVDALFLFLCLVTGSIALLVTVLVIGFAIKYRRRPDGTPTPRIVGSLGLEVFWTGVPLLVFMVMFVWGASVYFAASRPPDDALQVYVVGKQWMWKIQHTDGQREINELHVPVNQPVKLTLTSEDVIHDFGMPDFRLKIDVLPGRYVTTWFQATRVGRHHLFCDQYCGTNHAGMIGRVIVMEPGEYQDWLNLHAEGSLALQGRKTFLKYRCLSCHSADENARAPVLEELYGRRVHLRDGQTTTADDEYIRQSILDPGAKLVAGWENLMPTFRGQVSEEEIIELIAFLKGLRRGETPKRVEEFPAPTATPPINSEK